MDGIRLPPRKILSKGVEFELGPKIHAQGFPGQMTAEPGMMYSRGTQFNLALTGRTMPSHGQEIPIGPQISEAEAVFRAREGVIGNKNIKQKNYNESYPGVNESYPGVKNEQRRNLHEQMDIFAREISGKKTREYYTNMIYNLKSSYLNDKVVKTCEEAIKEGYNKFYREKSKVFWS